MKTIYIARGDAKLTWELCQDVIAAGYWPVVVEVA